MGGREGGEGEGMFLVTKEWIVLDQLIFFISLEGSNRHSFSAV